MVFFFFFFRLLCLQPLGQCLFASFWTPLKPSSELQLSSHSPCRISCNSSSPDHVLMTVNLKAAALSSTKLHAAHVLKCREVEVGLWFVLFIGRPVIPGPPLSFTKCPYIMGVSHLPYLHFPWGALSPEQGQEQTKGRSTCSFSTRHYFLTGWRLKGLTCHTKCKEAGDIPSTPEALIPGELRRPLWNGREENRLE